MIRDLSIVLRSPPFFPTAALWMVSLAVCIMMMMMMMMMSTIITMATMIIITIMSDDGICRLVDNEWAHVLRTKIGRSVSFGPSQNKTMPTKPRHQDFSSSAIVFRMPVSDLFRALLSRSCRTRAISVPSDSISRSKAPTSGALANGLLSVPWGWRHLPLQPINSAVLSHPDPRLRHEVHTGLGGFLQCHDKLLPQRYHAGWIRQRLIISGPSGPRSNAMRVDGDGFELGNTTISQPGSCAIGQKYGKGAHPGKRPAISCESKLTTRRFLDDT